MGYYIKARKIVYDYMGFSTGDRQKTPDGRYMLWQNDMIKLGGKLNIMVSGTFLEYIQTVARAVGAIVLTAQEAKQEQDGTVARSLPIATDPRFVDDEQRKQIDQEKAESTVNSEAATEQTDETEESTETNEVAEEEAASDE
jgi:hypothetical protein